MRLLFLALLATTALLSPAWGQAKSTPKPTPAPAEPSPSVGLDDKYIDQLLAEQSVQWGHVSWLVGRALGTFDEAVTPEAAARKASESGWAAGPMGSADTVDLASYSLLLMTSMKIPGGLLYSWFPGPRYAYRELVFRKIIPSNLPPDAAVTGEEAMRYLQAAQDWKETQK